MKYHVGFTSRHAEALQGYASGEGGNDLFQGQ